MISSQLSNGDDILASQYNNLRTDAMQVGTIILYTTDTAPSGWLLCSGQGLSTTTYSGLFGVIGYAYGGSGATFNLPDMADRFPISANTYSIGATGGGSVTLETTNLPSHTHTIGTGGGHYHYFYGDYLTGGATRNTVYADDSPSTGASTSPGGAHTHTITDSGSGTAISIEPPYIALYYIIKYT